MHFVEVNGIGEYNPLRDNETNGFIKAVIVIPVKYQLNWLFDV